MAFHGPNWQASGDANVGDATIRHVAGRGELGGTLDDPANDDFNHPTGILLDASGTKMTVAAWHNDERGQGP